MTLLSQVPSHTEPIFDNEQRRLLLDKTLEVIRDLEKELGYKIDAVVGCGFSGVPMATLVSHVTNKSLICVRKNNEVPVADDFKVNYCDIPHTCKYVIVEDILATGNTMNNTLKRMQKNKFRCEGIILYNQPEMEYPSFFACSQCSTQDLKWDEKCQSPKHKSIEVNIYSLYSDRGLVNYNPIPYGKHY